MMTTEDLIAKLALRLEWTNAAVSEALKAVIEVLKSELIENNPVTIDDFGNFSTVKQSEYILIDRETNERYLMPPAVEVVFEAKAVMPEWKTASLELCFTPDEELNESVNSYFAFFEPTLLNEGVEFPGIPEVIAEENQEIEPNEQIGEIGNIEKTRQVENDEQPEQMGEREKIEQANQSGESVEAEKVEQSIQAVQVDEVGEIKQVEQIVEQESVEQPKQVEQIVEQEFVEQSQQSERVRTAIANEAEKTERPQRTKSSGLEEKWHHRPDRKTAKRKSPSALWIPIMGGVAIAVAAYIFRQMTNPKK